MRIAGGKKDAMSTCEYTDQTKYAQALVLEALEIVYDMAVAKAIRYRLDPTIAAIHKKYVQEITQLMRDLNEQNYK